MFLCRGVLALMNRISQLTGTVASRLRTLPPLVTIAQTDGSFKIRTGISRTAVILSGADQKEYKLVRTYFDHKHSGESEWMSIVDGMEFALKKRYRVVQVENDCRPVVQSILQRKAPTDKFIREYYSHILGLSTEFEWLGLGWIPRRFNKADGLFRINT